MDLVSGECSSLELIAWGSATCEKCFLQVSSDLFSGKWFKFAITFDLFVRIYALLAVFGYTLLHAATSGRFLSSFHTRFLLILAISILIVVLGDSRLGIVYEARSGRLFLISTLSAVYLQFGLATRHTIYHVKNMKRPSPEIVANELRIREIQFYTMIIIGAIAAILNNTLIEAVSNNCGKQDTTFGSTYNESVYNRLKSHNWITCLSSTLLLIVAICNNYYLKQFAAILKNEEQKYIRTKKRIMFLLTFYAMSRAFTCYFVQLIVWMDMGYEFEFHAHFIAQFLSVFTFILDVILLPLCIACYGSMFNLGKRTDMTLDALLKGNEEFILPIARQHAIARMNQIMPISHDSNSNCRIETHNNGTEYNEDEDMVLKYVKLAEIEARFWLNGSLERWSDIFTYPDPVNKVLSRIQAAITVILLMLHLIIDYWWNIPYILLFVTIEFILRTTFGSRFNIQSHVNIFILRPLIADRWHLLDNEFTSGRPRRFSQFSAAFLSTIALSFRFAWPSYSRLSWAITGALIILSALQAWHNFCPACALWFLLETMGCINSQPKKP